MKRIGYWDEDGITEPQDYVDTSWRGTDRLRVISHLSAGMFAEGWFGYAMCRVCETENGAVCLSDGVWIWPEGYAHYVEKHAVRPPEGFVKYVLETHDPLNGHRPELKRAGFWPSRGFAINMAPGHEIPDRDTHWPWPADAHGDLDTTEAITIGAYLARGTDIDLQYDGTWEACQLGGEDGCTGEEWMPGHNSGRFQTDDVWVWPADYAHYVTIHRVAIPALLRSHILGLE